MAILFVLVSAGAGIWAFRDGTGDERPGAERAVLERRIEALERLVGPGRDGRLIPFEQALVAIDGAVIQDLLEAAMPYETEADGRFRIRVLSARVSCDDGLALVRLDGRASFLDRPEADAHVDATMHGALREFDLDREDSVLRGRVDVLALEVHRVKLGSGHSESLKGLLRDLGELRIEALGGLDYAFDVPVKLVHEIVLPEMELRPGVRIAEARVPLQASVTDVTALDGRLWISIRLREPGAADSAGAAARGRAAVASR